MKKDERDSLTILEQVDLINHKYIDLREQNLKLSKLEAFNLASKFVLSGLTDETLKMSQELDKRIAIEQRTRLEEYKKNMRSA